MRKLLLAFISFISLSSFSVKNPTPYWDKAQDMFQRVWALYRVSQYDLFSEYYPQNHKEDLNYFNDSIHKTQEVSYLWPMSGIFEAAISMSYINPSKYRCYVDSMATAMEMYYDTLRVPFAYQAYPSRFGKVDRYYDDNGLVGLDYIESYAVTRNPRYLEKAKQVMSFILSGWDDRFEGGVPWLEGVKDQKPACSNGMAMLLALKLYKVTNDGYYLHTGIRFYKWINKYLKDPKRGVVWNSWSTKSAAVSPDLYTYNTGSLLQAASLLYEFTKEGKYLNEANFLAEGSFNVFFKYTDEGVPYIKDIPWFNLVLFRGYCDLYQITKDDKYINVMIKGIDYAWKNARDVKGLFYRDWTGRNDEKRKPKWLLDEACIPDFYARIALIKGELKQRK